MSTDIAGDISCRKFPENLSDFLCVHDCVCFSSPYRGLLTLYAGAVEPQSRDVVRAALDVEDTLVVPLSGLGLGQVLGQQGDRSHNSSRYIDLGGGQDLRALLDMREI